MWGYISSGYSNAVVLLCVGIFVSGHSDKAVLLCGVYLFWSF